MTSFQQKKKQNWICHTHTTQTFLGGSFFVDHTRTSLSTVQLLDQQTVMETGKDGCSNPGCDPQSTCGFQCFIRNKDEVLLCALCDFCLCHKAGVSFYAVCCRNANVTPQHVMFHSDSRHVIVDPNPTEPDRTRGKDLRAATTLNCKFAKFQESFCSEVCVLV